MDLLAFQDEHSEQQFYASVPVYIRDAKTKKCPLKMEFAEKLKMILKPPRNARFSHKTITSDPQSQKQI